MKMLTLITLAIVLLLTNNTSAATSCEEQKQVRFLAYHLNIFVLNSKINILKEREENRID